MRKVLIIFSFTFLGMLFLFCCLLLYSDNYYKLREYSNQNTMEIKVNDDLDSGMINVYWSCALQKGQLIENGKATKFIYKEYGKNKFIVTYGKDTVKTFGYFKFNNWHGHKHVISLSKENNENIVTEVQISGPDVKRRLYYYN